MVIDIKLVCVNFIYLASRPVSVLNSHSACHRIYLFIVLNTKITIDEQDIIILSCLLIVAIQLHFGLYCHSVLIKLTTGLTGQKAQLIYGTQWSSGQCTGHS